MEILLLVLGLFLCLIWIGMYAYLMYAARKLPRFHRLSIAPIEDWPKLSIIIPACNEAEHIEDAVRTVLQQDYPELEIILVNDRSTDNTGEIVDRLASEDARIQAVHIETLPEGWLGKVHALHQGVQKSSGDWLLFSDADIHYAPGLLCKAIAYVQQERVDHLALLPRVILNSYWLDVAISTFGLMFLLNTRSSEINKPNSKYPIGIGAFNLVKREAFNRTPGFEWLRLEVVDDFGLGVMLKRAGAQTRFALADKDLSLGWYPSVRAMFRGLEKNLFGPGAGYQWWKVVMQVLLLWGLVAAPIVSLYSMQPWLNAASGVVVIMYLIFSIFFVREKQKETLSLLMFPVGLIMLSLMMAWAAYRCLKNDGIDWRGTHYSLDELRQGQRVIFK